MHTLCILWLDPLVSVPPLESCSVAQREAPLMSAWYVACASSVAWSPSPNARASPTLRIDAASSASRLPQGTSPTVSVRLTRTYAPQLSKTSPCLRMVEPSSIGGFGDDFSLNLRQWLSGQLASHFLGAPSYPKEP